ncbi:MAG: hypothetical protein ACRELY_11480 [Polyangiaceae bacterium]
MAASIRKVTLAIGNEEYAWAERRARRLGTSISAVLTAAARAEREEEQRTEAQRRAWTSVLDHVTSGVPLSAGELSAAEEELRFATRPAPLRMRKRSRRK